ncbi:hypothetical protein [Haladaptatus sp.]
MFFPTSLVAGLLTAAVVIGSVVSAGFGGTNCSPSFGRSPEVRCSRRSP